MTKGLEKSTLNFLSQLGRHNDREWFQKNKKRYLEAQANVAEWVDALILEMNRHDRIQTGNAKESLYRIYNDVRFSKDKAPYNPRFAGSLKRQKPQLRGGYYYWIKPGASRIGCGFSYPNPEDLKRIREDIDLNPKIWRKLLANKKLVAAFGAMKGEKVKTAPKGYPKDHPAIDLLRHKQFWFEHSFTDKKVLSKEFGREVSQNFKAIRPFFNYMSEVLTTNKNGEPI